MGMVFMVLFWAAFIALVVWVVRTVARPREAGGGGTQNPLDIAKNRYARGEISKEEFEQLKKDLA